MARCSLIPLSTCLSLVLPALIVHAATFSVNDLGDDSDWNPGDGIAETSPGNGVITLRAAIEETNALTGPDTIGFGLSGTIVPASPSLLILSDTTGGTTIDAQDETVILDGLTLRMTSSHNEIKGLRIINGGTGIHITGPLAFGNRVRGCLLGTDGTLGESNNVGVGITNGAYENVIGGVAEVDRNIISGNYGAGINIAGEGTMRNVVQGNFIGTDISGATPVVLADGSPQPGGVRVWIAATGNIIGGTEEGAGNVISGNFGGVWIASPGTDRNLVQGNLIGTDVTGTKGLGNLLYGVNLDYESKHTTVGGVEDGARNIISANGASGVEIQCESNVVQGNYIGTDLTGTKSLGNGALAGVNLSNDASNNQVGGRSPGAGNLISGNRLHGVYIRGPRSGNVIEGNLIGTDKTGTQDLGNGLSGVTLSDGAFENTIGGATEGAGNLISGNDQYGIYLLGGRLSRRTERNVIEGNHIGSDLTGKVSIPNSSDGIVLFSGTFDNRIGGEEAGAGNVIMGNKGDGIRIIDYWSPDREGWGTTGNQVRRNSIYRNSGKGIRLELGANDNIQAPVISGLQPLMGTAPPHSIVEIFADSDDEGEIYIESVTAGGDGSFTSSSNFDFYRLRNITSTATDASGNTSEFSLPHRVPGQSLWLLR